MTFTLKPDDNGIVVVLSNVDEADEADLKKANEKGFDPTEAPFDKYYEYDKRIGFFVGKDHFDHAEHKGKRLSYGDYMALTAGDSIEDTKAQDANSDVEFIASKIAEIKMPKTVEHAITALSTLSFAMNELKHMIDSSDESHKEAYHKALEHAFDIYAKADELLGKSNIDALMKLADKLKQYRDESANLQAMLLQKYNENF